jgi:hypothetical protein
VGARYDSTKIRHCRQGLADPGLADPRANRFQSLPIIELVILLDENGLMGEATTFLSILILVLFLFIAFLERRLIRMENRLAKLIPLDAKLDLLLKAAGLEYDPLAQLPGEVATALRAGKKIEAIKRYREAMSVSLAEAKSVVEEAQRRAGLTL